MMKCYFMIYLLLISFLPLQWARLNYWSGCIKPPGHSFAHTCCGPLFLTYEGDPLGGGRQDLVENQLHHCDGQQHRDLEAELLAASVRDEEGGQVQTQEEEDGQQEVDDVELRPPLHGDLVNDIQEKKKMMSLSRTGWMYKSVDSQ